MALQSKTINSSVTSNQYQLHLDLTEISNDVSTNTSSISWTLRLTSGSWNFQQYQIGWSVSLNGSVVSSKARSSAPSVSISKNGSLTVASGTVTVPHSADGTLTMSAAASIDMTSVSYTPGPMSLSGSMALTNIPRASTLTAANGTLGTAQTLTINRASSGFTHMLTYTCGSTGGTIATKTGSTSISWTPPLSLAAQNTTGTSVNVTVSLDTYNGSTKLGSKSYTLTMTIPASVKPVVSISTSNPEGHLSKYGGYVQGKSTCKIVLSVTEAQGAAIKSYSIKVGSKLAYTTNGATTGALPEAGNAIKVTAVVTDARGRSGSTEVTIKVLAYAAPRVPLMAVDRDGEQGKVSFSANVTALGNKNSAAYALKYRERGTGTYETVSLSGYTGQYDVSGTATFPASTDKSYDCLILATDDFGTVNGVVSQVPSEEVFLRTTPEMAGLSIGQAEVKDKEVNFGWHVAANAGLSVNGYELPLIRWQVYTYFGALTGNTSIAMGNLPENITMEKVLFVSVVDQADYTGHQSGVAFIAEYNNNEVRYLPSRTSQASSIRVVVGYVE